MARKKATGRCALCGRMRRLSRYRLGGGGANLCSCYALTLVPSEAGPGDWAR